MVVTQEDSHHNWYLVWFWTLCVSGGVCLAPGLLLRMYGWRGALHGFKSLSPLSWNRHLCRSSSFFRRSFQVTRLVISRSHSFIRRSHSFSGFGLQGSGGASCTQVYV